MFGFLLTLMILDGLLLAGVILMQAGQGGGLASLGGGTASQVLGGRGATTLLTKATWWCGGIFMGLALLLSLSSSRVNTGTSAVGQKVLQQSQPQRDLPTNPLNNTGTPAPLPGATGSAPAGGAAPLQLPTGGGTTPPTTKQPATPPPASKKP